MNKTNAFVAYTATVLLNAAVGPAAQSDPIILFTSPRQSRQWMTVTNSEIPLRWEWPAGAAWATLEIAGMNGGSITEITQGTTNYLWCPFSAAAPVEEDVVDVTVTFFGNGGETLDALTARLAIVKGAFREATVVGRATDPSWARVKENALIPYDASWMPESETNAATARLTITRNGGGTQTFAFQDAAGYQGWKLRRSEWGYGLFTLNLSFLETEWWAMVERTTDGAVISIR